MTSRSKKNSVAKVLQQLKQRFRRMGMVPNDLARFIDKADAVVRELNTTRRNSKRRNKVIAELLSEFVAQSTENDAE